MPSMSLIWGYFTEERSDTPFDDGRDWITRSINILPYQSGGYPESDFDSALPVTLFEPDEDKDDPVESEFRKVSKLALGR